MESNLHDSRLRIGIIFNFSPKWMGGIFYVINIVRTLNYLEDKDKPEIYLFYKADLKGFVGEIDYPFLSAIEWVFPSVLIGNLGSMFSRKNLFIQKILKDYSLDALFPLHDFPVKNREKVRLLSWWADLQHKHYPDFFSWAQILARNVHIRLILRNSDGLLVSSRAVLNDFLRYYKSSSFNKIHVFHFVSVIDKLPDTDMLGLRKQYNLPEKYFIVSNQFHKHKNHKVVLLSLSLLKRRGIRLHIVFTGKFPDALKSYYMSELHKIIADNGLHDQVSMLGVIPREDQLQLMKHSQAVIQPSLFEGWSTVIEDAKSLQVPVVASDLTVNIEQLGDGGIYFNPNNADELATILANYPLRNLDDIFYESYDIRVRKAALELFSIINHA